MVQTFYVSRQGCTLGLHQNTVLVQHRQAVVDQVQLPLLEQLIIFGRSQVTTAVLQACCQRRIPIAYLSHSGYFYGRVMPAQTWTCRWVGAQHRMAAGQRLQIAQQLITAKLRNSRVLLQRQQRRSTDPTLDRAIAQLRHLSTMVGQASSTAQLFGLEGAGAAAYFPALGTCFTNPDFTFTRRSRRPPLDPVNAMLSFGYQLVWGHLLLAVELKGLDPYRGCLHEPADDHPALVSDLVEQFRAPLVDSLVLYLVNHRMVQRDRDFEQTGRACYLNDSGRRIFLQAFLQRMDGLVQVEGSAQPRWALLNQQVKALIRCLDDSDAVYQPFLIR
jgi:CRISPR-associated protein Cas1